MSHQDTIIGILHEILHVLQTYACRSRVVGRRRGRSLWALVRTISRLSFHEKWSGTSTWLKVGQGCVSIPYQSVMEQGLHNNMLRYSYERYIAGCGFSHKCHEYIEDGCKSTCVKFGGWKPYRTKSALHRKIIYLVVGSTWLHVDPAPFAKVFSAKLEIYQKRESFVPRKFPAIRYCKL